MRIMSSKSLNLLLPFAAAITQLFLSSLRGAPVSLFEEAPAGVREIEPGVVLVDFGRVAFGNLLLVQPENPGGTVKVHFGEAFKDGRIDRKPPGTVRYASAEVTLNATGPVVIAPPADKRNTNQPGHLLRPPEWGVVLPAVLTPPEWGVVLPFRWVEIEGWHGPLRPEQIRRRAAFATSWNDDAAAFRCSDELLNRIWELCRYSIKATTFAGVYVDGDRERIVYESDSYVNQLCHFATDNDVQMARDTFDWFMVHPTWTTEKGPHAVFMAYTDWMHTGDKAWLKPRFERLKTKLLLERTRRDGLVISAPEQIEKGDLVDWPRSERADFVFTEANTVINAYHLRAIRFMAEMAQALGRDADAQEFARRFRETHEVFQRTFFDEPRGIYRDGAGTEHASFHANLFPLGFGLVPGEHRPRITRWLLERGMGCSPFAAQFLLEGLFMNGAAQEALELMTATTDRSWRHMLERGATITWEAWDARYKPNLDWNHAWSAAPANLLPRFVLGAQPLAPGWKRALIRPHTGNLSFSTGKVPTPLGPIMIDWNRNTFFTLSLSLPQSMSAKVELPATEASRGVFVNSKPAGASRAGDYWILDQDVVGNCIIEVR